MQYYFSQNKTLLHHVTVSLINGGRKVFYIGDTTDVRNRLQVDTVIFDSSRSVNFIPWNPVKGNPSVLADTFIDTWYEGQSNAGSSYYQSMEHLFLTASFYVFKANNLNLFHLPFFLTNSAYRKSLLTNVSDEFIKEFWSQPLEKEDVASIYFKVSALLLNPITRRVFYPSKNRLEGKVVLVDLNLPPTETRLLGSLMLSQAEGLIIVEDCSKYSPAVLIELINSGHDLILGYQYKEQISQPLYDAIIGNCASKNSTVAKQWGSDVEIKEFNWGKHDRNYTRLSEKADKQIRGFMERWSG